jgi:ribosomal protein S27AE
MAEMTDDRVMGFLHRCQRCGEVVLQVHDDDGHLTNITKICGDCGVVMFRQIIWADCNIEKNPQIGINLLPGDM